MKRALYLFFVATMLVSFSSCEEEGCMDKDACNFDADAEKDDGSCNYGCKPTVTPCVEGERKFYDVLARININGYDYTPGSPYQGSMITSITITQNRFQTCTNGTNSLGYTENIIAFKNVTGRVMSFDYTITQNYNGNYKQYQGYVSALGAGQSVEFNTGDNTFYNLKNSQVQVVSQKIIYQ